LAAGMRVICLPAEVGLTPVSQEARRGSVGILAGMFSIEDSGAAGDVSL